MIRGNFQKNLMESYFHRHGIENAVGTRNVAAMMVVRSGILAFVVGRKLVSVGVGSAMGCAPVFPTMRVAVNHTRPEPCENAKEEKESGCKGHAIPLGPISGMGKDFSHYPAV